MQLATPQTVLGDFNNAELHYHGIHARMFQRDGRYWIHTEGPDGQMRDFEVKYTFGVSPLQQYIVELDSPADQDGSPTQASAETEVRNDAAARNTRVTQGSLDSATGPPETNHAVRPVGRLQVLRECWDTEKKQWFYLPPPDVRERLAPDDDLHWTGIGQRWNTMCAECHSTNVQKNYDPETGKYQTTFSEISVGCEACHGPGSIHIRLAKAFSLFWDRKRGYALAKLKGDDPQPQIQACAFCHSRRRVLDLTLGAGDGFHNRCVLELPSPSTYFADGQILDEVYEVGSFLQSKMYHKNVRCTDCHDPHSGRLKYSGNTLCTSCHQHPAGRYDTPAHHQHRPGSSGASCINCHMPETFYMEVDGRRDHSLRIPRPDLSVQYGVPNACTGCHLERAAVPQEVRKSLTQYRDWLLAARQQPQIRDALKSVDQWADQALQQWFPHSQVRHTRHYAAELARAWHGDVTAFDDVLRVCRTPAYPAVMRAAAWQWLRGTARGEVLAQATEALRDPDPLIRLAAVGLWEPYLPSVDDVLDRDEAGRAALAVELRSLLAPLWPLLEDPARAVRVEVASLLARVPAALLVEITDGQQRSTLQHVVQEWMATLEVYNDRAGAHLALGVYNEARGDEDAAEKAYALALRVEPRTVGPRSNLAALLERRRNRLQQQVQRAILERDRAALSSLTAEIGKLQERIETLRREELSLLERDARLAPDNVDVLYRYGLALYLNGQEEKAAEVLERGAERAPDATRFHYALALLYQKRQQLDLAIRHAERLTQLDPGHEPYRLLLEELRKQQQKPQSSQP